MPGSARSLTADPVASRRLFSAAFVGEGVIFLFPLFSEVCAFGAAVYVKNSGTGHGGQLLMLLAAIKLAASILEYKGFEEAYFQNEFGAGSLFARIGLLQLAQGVLLPGVIIAVARHVLAWDFDPLYTALLVWTGIITAARQFVSYHWRAQFRTARRRVWWLAVEIFVAYGWMGVLCVAAMLPRQVYGPALAEVVQWGSKVWIVGIALLLLIEAIRRGPRLLTGLTWRKWLGSLGQSFTAQLSKEFFILACTFSLTTGFIARTTVILYGLAVAYPLTFFRLRLFDRHLETSAAVPSRQSLPAAESQIRKISVAFGVGVLGLLPLAEYLRHAIRPDFPVFASLLALGLVYPMAAFEVLAYFELIRENHRERYSIACAAGGMFAIAAGGSIARMVAEPGVLAFLFTLLLGLSDFIVNRITKILAYR